MKVECPVCNLQGLLQQRGNSSRIQHYVGYKDGKRVYLYHKLEVNGSNGSKLLEVKKIKSSPNCNLLVRSPGFEPGLSGWEPDVLTKLDYDRKDLKKKDV